MQAKISDAIEQWPIEKLTAYARNARTHTPKQVRQIAESIKAFGWASPVLVAPDGQIIAGHGRVLAAAFLKRSKVPVLVARGWSDAQKRAYILADNKIAMNAGWDETLLSAELRALENDGFAMDALGFTEQELFNLTKDETVEQETVAAVPEAPVSKLGDLWVLGDHRVLCGDATDQACYESLLEGKKADMTFTDPPYNVDYTGGSGGKQPKILNDNLGSGFHAFLLAALSRVVANTTGGIYVAMSSSELDVLQSAFRQAGGHWSTFIIWAKDRFSLGRSDYQRQYEPILYGWPEGQTRTWTGNAPEGGDYDGEYEPILYGWPKDGKRDWGGGRSQGDLWQIGRVLKNDLHPTMKPTELVERAVRNSSVRGGLVLDAFSGSGTTVIACENLGRKARCLELSPGYVDVIVRRWELHTGELAVRADGKKFQSLAKKKLATPAGELI